MKNARLYLGTLAGFGALTALTILLIFLFRSAGLIQGSRNSAAPAVGTCVPTPAPPTNVPWTPTPTPDQLHFGTPGPQSPTLTPIPINRTVDLSPELPEADKIHWLVFHCDGSYEMFLTAPSTQQAPLQPGDVVIYTYLPSLMGHSVPASTLALPDTPVPPPTIEPEVFTEAVQTAAARMSQPYPPPASP